MAKKLSTLFDFSDLLLNDDAVVAVLPTGLEYLCCFSFYRILPVN